MKPSLKAVAGIAAVLGLGVAAGAFAQAGASDDPHSRPAEIARKGALVMPFDLAKTTHYFDDTVTGGVETITANDKGDARQVQLVRSHLSLEAQRFAYGDFTDPAKIHGNDMPGLAALATAGNALRVTYREVPGGASLSYTSRDQAVVTSIHDWFAAQRSDHVAHAHMHQG